MQIVTTENGNQDQNIDKELINLFNSPAYPPQILMDNYNQLVAPVPGQSNLLNIAANLYPYYVRLFYESGMADRHEFREEENFFEWPSINAINAAKAFLKIYNAQK